jgi:hypothetical protein
MSRPKGPQSSASDADRSLVFDEAEERARLAPRHKFKEWTTYCKKDGEGTNAWFRFKSVFQRHAADGFEQLAKLEEFGPDRVFVSAPLKQFQVGRLPPDQRRMLELLGSLGDGASVNEWRDAAKDGGLWPKAKNWRSNWQRARRALEMADLIEISGGMVSRHHQ